MKEAFFDAMIHKLGKAMDEHEINIEIEPGLTCDVKEARFKSIILEILTALCVATPAELGLVITDSATIQQLNKTYRDIDEPTDVLAFPMLSRFSQENEPGFVIPPDGVHHLGEIIISYPEAIQQAEQQRHEIAQELTTLIIHGVLHLLGYDHKLPEEEQSMMTKEREIMKKLSSRKDVE